MVGVCSHVAARMVGVCSHVAARMVGVCSHVAAILWYLGFARYTQMESIGVRDWHMLVMLQTYLRLLMTLIVRVMKVQLTNRYVWIASLLLHNTSHSMFFLYHI